MTRHSLVAAALALLAALAVACGGGNDGSDGATATVAEEDPTAGESTEGPDGAPSEFEERRDRLAAELDAIGINIGVLPDDVRQNLLARCAELADFADAEPVDEICSAIDQAIERGDAGLIDLVLDDLAELEAE